MLITPTSRKGRHFNLGAPSSAFVPTLNAKPGGRVISGSKVQEQELALNSSLVPCDWHDSVPMPRLVKYQSIPVYLKVRHHGKRALSPPELLFVNWPLEPCVSRFFLPAHEVSSWLPL